MATIKTAITVQEDLLKEVDRAARDRGESRSAFINRILQAAVKVRRDQQITRALDELFSDPELVRHQRDSARELDDAGTSWDDEAW